MNDTEYLVLAETLYHKIEDAIEASEADIDYDQNGSLLTLEFDNRSKLIINRQQPLHQIWLATPENGHHYDYIDEKWIDNRSGDEFLHFLSNAIYKQSEQTVSF
ncbi:MAG TPA: iron donor protein CyaY [Psychromonas hadalis]|nr:iron donor protein CyaY [Psychromonas hadalis]